MVDLGQEQWIFYTFRGAKYCEYRKFVVPLHRQKVNRLFQVSSNIYSFRFLVIGRKKVLNVDNRGRREAPLTFKVSISFSYDAP